MASPTLGTRLLRVLLLAAGAVAAFLLWSLLTSDAAAAATPEATPGKVIDVDLDVGAPTPGAPLPDAAPPVGTTAHVDPTEIPALADAPFQPIDIAVSTSPPRIELPTLLPPAADATPVPAPGAADNAPPPDKGRSTDATWHKSGSRPLPDLTALFTPSLALDTSGDLPNEPAEPAAGPGTNSESDGIPIPPQLLAVLGAALVLAALTARDWSWLARTPRSTLLAFALERPG